jgi:hypothetical protein
MRNCNTKNAECNPSNPESSELTEREGAKPKLELENLKKKKYNTNDKPTSTPSLRLLRRGWSEENTIKEIKK